MPHFNSPYTYCVMLFPQSRITFTVHKAKVQANLWEGELLRKKGITEFGASHFSPLHCLPQMFKTFFSPFQHHI